MPVIFRHGPWKVFFYANEGDPREPAHVHIRAGRAEAKIWLRPEVKLAYSTKMSDVAVREALRLAEDRRAQFEAAWDALFA